MLLQETVSQVKFEIPSEVFWSVICGLLIFIGWIGQKYYTRLETILERLDVVVEKLSANQTLLENEQSHMREKQEKHEERLIKLEEASKRRR